DGLLDEYAFEGRRIRLGVLRTYFTRHGPGPMVSEDAALRERLPAEPHNSDGGWQGQFRVGALDVVAARYGLAATGGVDALAVTHLDRLAHLPPHLCTGYRTSADDFDRWFLGANNVASGIRRRPSATHD